MLSIYLAQHIDITCINHQKKEIVKNTLFIIITSEHGVRCNNHLYKEARVTKASSECETRS